MSAIPAEAAAAGPPARPTFRDARLQQVFARQGYATVPLLSREEAAATLAKLEAMRRRADASAGAPESAGGTQSSYLHPDRDYRRRVHDLVSFTLAPRLAEVLADYAPLIGTFLVKPAGAGTMHVHCDLNWSADQDDVNVNVWCPLVDVDEGNGAVRLLAGSHKLVEQVATPHAPVYWSDYVEAIMERAVPVPLRAGEAVIFDSSIPHWSPANQSDAPRPAISLTLIAPGAAPAFYRADPSSSPERFEMIDMRPDGYFAHSMDELRRGEVSGDSLGFIANRNRPLARAEFDARLAERGFPAPAEATADGHRRGVLGRLRALIAGRE